MLLGTTTNAKPRLLRTNFNGLDAYLLSRYCACIFLSAPIFWSDTFTMAMASFKSRSSRESALDVREA